MVITESENIGQAFTKQAQDNPQKVAAVFLGTEFSYAGILQKALAFSSGLAEMGIQPGDRVIIYLSNSPQWMICWLGILFRGAVAVPITPIYTTHDLAYIANDTDAGAIVCLDTNYSYVEEVRANTQIKKIVYTNQADLLPLWKRCLGVLLDRVPRGKVGKSKYAVSLRRVLGHSAPPTAPVEVPADSLAEILYTGGTTKHPKGVPITHRLFLKSAVPVLQVGESQVPWGQNVILQGAPLFHILGQIFGMGSLCISGDTVIPLPRMNLDGMLDIIQRRRVRTLFGVPAMFRMILDHDRLDFYDLSSLKYCLSGGDVLPGEIGRRWKERFGLEIGRGYGSTETVGGIAVSNPDSDCPKNSLGPLLPHKSMKIVEPGLKEIDGSAPGELLVRSDPMVTEYWNNAEETERAFVCLDGQLWYRTGDIISKDEDGFLYFVDRTIDIIKHKGYRVSASEVEAVLLEHPSVVGACVVGIPDEKVGERIKAFIVLKEDIKGMTGTDLIRWCRKILVSYKVPQYIEFRDMLPKSKVGKLLRREVRKDEEKRKEKGKWAEAVVD